MREDGVFYYRLDEKGPETRNNVIAVVASL